MLISSISKTRESSRSNDSAREDDKSDVKQLKRKKSMTFVDAEEMKERVRANVLKQRYTVTAYYGETGVFQRIARAKAFEYVTLTVIAANAVWIAVDTELNHADTLINADPIFQVADHFFCIFFSLEWLVRFMSFKTKLNGLRDAWFVFDSCLVAVMVLETWVMMLVLWLTGSGAGGSGLGNASLLRLARLLRLTRVVRMARLLKATPELLFLIRGLAISIRSCTFVVVLLILLMYIFGIAFRQLTLATELEEKYFKTIFHAMYTLWIDGTLLHEPGGIAMDLAEQDLVLAFLFYGFVLLSALTILNMLVGMLCEVVRAVALTEKESLTVSWVKSKMQDIFTSSGLDQDRDGEISKSELSKLLDLPEACEALQEVGVDVERLIDNIDFIFQSDIHDKKEMVFSFEQFMNLVLDHRGTNTATIKDVVELQKYIKQQNRCLLEEIKSKVISELTFSWRGSPVSQLKSAVEAPSGVTVGVDLENEIGELLRKTLIPELCKLCSQIQNDCLAGIQHVAVQLPEDMMSLTKEDVATVSSMTWNGNSKVSCGGHCSTRAQLSLQEAGDEEANVTQNIEESTADQSSKFTTRSDESNIGLLPEFRPFGFSQNDRRIRTKGR